MGNRALFSDPDNNTRELSYGQQIGVEIFSARNM
jgi:hypothetical protein